MPDLLYQDLGPGKSQKSRRVEGIQEGRLQQQDQRRKLVPEEGQNPDWNIITTNQKATLK